MGIFQDIASKLLSQKEGTPLPSISQASDQSPDDKKLVEYVKTKIDMTRQANSRIALEGIYLTNVAYLLGFDGIYYDTTYRQFRNLDPRRKLTRNRFKINKILPTVQNRLARLVQNSPKYDVRPNSNSNEDKDCARLGVEIINDIFDKQNFKEKQQDKCMAAMQGGVAYIQTTWDPTLGEPMFENGQLVGYAGDVRLEVLNCLEVFPDPLAKSLEDAQWVIKAKVRKLDYFKDHYPDRGQAVKEENTWLLSSLYDLKANALTSVGISGANTSEQQKNSAIELVYYEKRSKDYPNGRMVVCANGVLLEDKELPIGEFDIVKFDDILVGGRYNSEGIITHLRPIQDQYNITRTKCADWIKKTLGGKFIAAKGAGLMQEALNNDSGEVVEFTPVPNAPPPSPMPVPSIPSYVYQDIETLDGEFNFVSGLGETTQGDSPSSNMPWRGMALLVEQNQTRLSVQTNRNEIGYAKVGSHVLKYVSKYYEMPRMIKVAGDGLEYTVKEFKGADLNDNCDVFVLPGSTLPGSKVLKRQDIINAYQMGLLGDPQDPKVRAKVFKELEFGDVSEMWKEQALDEQQVKKAIESIEAGEKPMAHEWDNHQMFIQKLNEYRKTDKFDDLSDQQKAMLNFVVEEHIQFLVTLQNPGLAQQQFMAQHMVNTMQAHPMMQPGAQGQSPMNPPDPTQQPGAPGIAPPMGA